MLPDTIKAEFAVVVCKVQRLNKAKSNSTKTNMMAEQLVNRRVDSRLAYFNTQGNNIKHIFKSEILNIVNHLYTLW